MNHSVFAYPGNKAALSEWIVGYFPAHQCYVEPFGGAAGVLANKPQSHNEVYNDVDEDLVQFFDVLRERGDELIEWLEDVPYARTKYDEWAGRWYSEGWRPRDPVRRAGVFFYLRCTAFGGTYQYPGGFATSSTRNQARTFAGQIDRLKGFARRFDEVVLENLDWRACIERYDSETTLFYGDPPYYANRCRYRYGHDFWHEGFAEVLAEIEGDWIVSYGELPPKIEAAAVATDDYAIRYQMGAGYNGEGRPSTERLAMSYDPVQRDPFIERQRTLAEVADGG